MKQLVKWSVVALAATGLTACSTSSTLQTYSPQPSACINNPFLQKYDCSLKQVEQAAEQGEPDAEYALGYMYYYGVSTTQDTKTARIWIKRAAAHGQPLAVKAMKLLSKQAYPGQGDVVVNPKVAPATKAALASETKNDFVAKKRVAPTKVTGIAAIPSAHYTVQLMGSYDPARIARFVMAEGLGANAMTYHTTFHGKSWTVLIYGDYPTYAAAKAAISMLPAHVRAQRPWVKSYALVHKDMS